ncbi:GspE/PulE family protein [Patescibacteria group bacterium]
MITFDEKKQKRKIETLHKKEEEEVTQILSEKYDLPYANLSDIPIELDYLKLIPEEQSHQGKIVVFQGVGKKIQVGMQNPNLSLTKNILEKLKKNHKVQSFLVSSKSLGKAWEKYKEVPEFVELTKGVIKISPERIEEFLSQTTTLEKLKEIFLNRVKSKEKRRISELLEIMLGGALKMDASDIHLEPQEGNIVKMRLRLDGVLHDITSFQTKAYQLILSRIKLISEMKLNIKEKAQDGRFSIKALGTEIEVRSSALPGPYGESIVLRLLNPKTISVPLKELGIQPQLLEIIKKEIKRPNGMILTTGPTGSGKTTTLYAFLKEIKSSDIKIITIEEPIEYHLEGVTQTQTNPKKGYDFSTGLSSILRQDPDIIMVGEIRDLKAATIALNAALTGHLVFSTLHTNDATGTIPRLIELGAKPAIIAPAINISIAQRLVRKLCEYCKKTDNPTKEEQIIIEKTISSFPKNTPKPDIKSLKISKPAGCEKCSSIGYKGRIGIFEAILINDEMEKLILKRPSESEIKETWAKQETLNMRQNAILKIIEGTTSFKETKRVIELN